MKIVLVAVLPILLLLIVQQTVDARNGIPGGDQARADFLNSNGKNKNPSCNPNEHTDAYCTGYKIAYELKWIEMSLLYNCRGGECR